MGVEKSMILLLSVNEADCLDHQHRRTSGRTNRQHSRRSAYRASGLVHRPFSDTHVANFDARKRSLYVRVDRATTASWPTPKGYTAYRQTGLGGLPLALRLSKGLSITR